jgi:hypothetical protein
MKMHLLDIPHASHQDFAAIVGRADIVPRSAWTTRPSGGDLRGHHGAAKARPLSPRLVLRSYSFTCISTRTRDLSGASGCSCHRQG